MLKSEKNHRNVHRKAHQDGVQLQFLRIYLDAIVSDIFTDVQVLTHEGRVDH